MLHLLKKCTRIRKLEVFLGSSEDEAGAGGWSWNAVRGKHCSAGWSWRNVRKKNCRAGGLLTSRTQA